jgi:hypothetical protein
MRARLLIQAGYPVRHDDLTMSEWISLGLIEETIKIFEEKKWRLLLGK